MILDQNYFIRIQITTPGQHDFNKLNNLKTPEQLQCHSGVSADKFALTSLLFLSMPFISLYK